MKNTLFILLFLFCSCKKDATADRKYQVSLYGTNQKLYVNDVDMNYSGTVRIAPCHIGDVIHVTCDTFHYSGALKDCTVNIGIISDDKYVYSTGGNYPSNQDITLTVE